VRVHAVEPGALDRSVASKLCLLGPKSLKFVFDCLLLFDGPPEETHTISDSTGTV